MRRPLINAGHRPEPEEGPRAGFLARFLHRSASIKLLARLSRAFHVAVFRLSRGRLLGSWFGAPVLVIETVGRRTGRRRRIPVTYCQAGDSWVVVAINAGSARTPVWLLNLRESPESAVLLGTRRVPVRAREPGGEEREHLWRMYAEQTPVINEFLSFTDRAIPLVVLEPLTHP